MSATEDQFWKMPVAIAIRSDIGPAAKLVYAYLRNRNELLARGYEVEAGGVRTIAAQTGLSVGAVRRAIKALEDAGLLKVDRVEGNPAGQPSRYTLNSGDVPEMDTCQKRRADVPEMDTTSCQKRHTLKEERLKTNSPPSPPSRGGELPSRPRGRGGKSRAERELEAQERAHQLAERLCEDRDRPRERPRRPAGEEAIDIQAVETRLWGKAAKAWRETEQLRNELIRFTLEQIIDEMERQRAQHPDSTCCDWSAIEHAFRAPLNGHVVAAGGGR